MPLAGHHGRYSDIRMYVFVVYSPATKKAKYTIPMLPANAAMTNPTPIKQPPTIAAILCDVRLIQNFPNGAEIMKNVCGSILNKCT